jgi:hypothetical protein
MENFILDCGRAGLAKRAEPGGVWDVTCGGTSVVDFARMSGNCGQIAMLFD